MSHCSNKHLKAWHGAAQQSACRVRQHGLCVRVKAVYMAGQGTVYSVQRSAAAHHKRCMLLGKQACGCAHRPLPRYGCIFTGGGQWTASRQTEPRRRQECLVQQIGCLVQHTLLKAPACGKATASRPTPTGHLEVPTECGVGAAQRPIVTPKTTPQRANSGQAAFPQLRQCLEVAMEVATCGSTSTTPDTPYPATSAPPCM